jgi:hypothetical protein
VVDQLLVGVAGVVVGALLGGSGKYFTLRRDAWTEARASGLLLLAEVQALGDACRADPVVAGTSVVIKGWESHAKTLAHFRRGNFPNGFKAPEWLELAGCVARLERFHAAPQADPHGKWRTSVNRELDKAERLLDRFKEDPPVFNYVVGTGIRKYIAFLAPGGGRQRKIEDP